MEIRTRSTVGRWPFVAVLLALLTGIVVGHGCHGGGHEEDDELVYRPAAYQTPQNQSPESVQLGAR